MSSEKPFLHPNPIGSRSYSLPASLSSSRSSTPLPSSIASNQGFGSDQELADIFSLSTRISDTRLPAPSSSPSPSPALFPSPDLDLPLPPPAPPPSPAVSCASSGNPSHLDSPSSASSCSSSELHSPSPSFPVEEEQENSMNDALFSRVIIGEKRKLDAAFPTSPPPTRLHKSIADSPSPELQSMKS